MDEDDTNDDDANIDTTSLLHHHPHPTMDGINNTTTTNNPPDFGAMIGIGSFGMNTTSSAPPLAVGTEDDNTTANNAKGGESSSNSNNPLSPSRFFTDDASDLIGRFFFGMPNTAAAAAAPDGNDIATLSSTATNAEGSGKQPIKRTDSSSSMSTMTASAAGRVGTGGGAVGSTQHDGRNALGDQKNPNTGKFDRSSQHQHHQVGQDYSSVWDQDEIDLWRPNNNNMSKQKQQSSSRSSSSRGGSEKIKQSNGGPTNVESRVIGQKKNMTAPSLDQLNTNKGEGGINPTRKTSAEEKQKGEEEEEESSAEDNWASRRRRHRERRKKRQDWDALRTMTANNHADGPTSTTSSSLANSNNNAMMVQGMNQAIATFHQQQALLSLPNREPATSTSDTKGSAVTDGDKQKSSQPQQPTKGGGGGGAVIVDDGKQHWMPDNLCKHCYSCEAPFTLLRRKHHCRVCGMIFCTACSAYFVQISSDGGGMAVDNNDPGKSSKKETAAAAGTMRTCKMCYDHLNERGLGVIVRGGGVEGGGGPKKQQQQQQSGDLKPTSASEGSMKKQPSSLGVDQLAEGGGGGPPMTRKGSARDVDVPLPPSDTAAQEATASMTKATAEGTTPPELTEQFAGFQGEAENSTAASNFQALSITKQRLDEERRRCEEHELLKAEASAAAAAKAEEEAAAEAALTTPEKSGIGRLRSIGSSARQLKWKGSLAPSKNAEEETINANSNAVEVSFGDGTATDDFESSLHEHLQQNVKQGKTSSAFLENTNSGIEEALAFGPTQCNDAKLSARIHLGMVAANYLEKLGRELLKTDAPLLLEEIKQAAASSATSSSVGESRTMPSTAWIESKLTDLWVNTLMTLATRCCATVEPDVKAGDLLDIRPYCKLKVIPGGSVEDSAYMSGVVFHKNVSHKKMATIIPNAKIMMLSGGIEYTRTENRIASLDTLLEQEERYMEILVTKIFKLKPDVLFVGKSVCRKAQELLLRANIALIQM